MKSRYGMELRAAAPADAPGLSELFQACGIDLPPRVLAERLEALRGEPGAALLALAWGPPSGIVVLNWYRTLTAAHPVARIGLLLVAPDERRSGIGRALLKAASQAARTAGCADIELAVRPEASGLQEFCLATGFVQSEASFTRPLRKKA